MRKAWSSRSVHGRTAAWPFHFLIVFSCCGVCLCWKRSSCASSFLVAADLAVDGAGRRNWLAEVRCHGFHVAGSAVVACALRPKRPRRVRR